MLNKILTNIKKAYPRIKYLSLFYSGPNSKVHILVNDNTEFILKVYSIKNNVS